MNALRTIGPAVLVSLAAMALPLRADILHPNEGGEIVSPTRREGADLILETPMGVYRFPRRDFRDVIPTLDPAREWPDRRDKALAGGAAERTAARALGARLRPGPRVRGDDSRGPFRRRDATTGRADGQRCSIA